MGNIIKAIADLILNKGEDSSYFNSDGGFKSHEHFKRWHMENYGHPDYCDWYDEASKNEDLGKYSYRNNYKKYCETYEVMAGGSVSTETESECGHKWRIVADGDVVGSVYGDFQKKCICTKCGAEGTQHEYGFI